MGDLEQAFRHYHEAVRLNPEHRGAHEYIGEAYLAAGNLAKPRSICASHSSLSRRIHPTDGQSSR